jgi:lipase ATG15
MRIPLITSLAPLIFDAAQDLSAQDLAPSPPPTLSFTPRHAHAQSLDRAAPLLFADTPASVQAAAQDDMIIRTRRSIIRRPVSRPPEILSWAKSAHARAAGGNASINGWASPTDWEGGWEDVEVDTPDVTDRQTLLTLAKMAANAYSQHDDYGWYPIEGSNNGTEFGWEPDADGLRGHVFADENNSTVVIAIKGTSAGVLGSGGPTAKNDKFNVSRACARRAS